MAELRLAGRIGATVELRAIVLGRVDFSLLVPDDLAEAENELNINVDAVDGEPDVLTYVLKLTLVGLPELREWGFRAEVTYYVMFDRREGVTHNDDEVIAFGRVTVAPTVVPYLRELVHGLTFKAGIPPYVLPLFRVALPTFEPASTTEGE